MGSSSAQFGEQDLYLFNEGSHFRLWEKLGSHPGPGGTHFAVWAPNAESVSVVGDFNGWRSGVHPLSRLGGSGIWEGVVEDAGPGAVYKYHLARRGGGWEGDKTDPLAITCEVSPATASLVWKADYLWADEPWMAARSRSDPALTPWSIYEVHPGSWRRRQDGGQLNYRELAHELADHALALGFTHVELMPVMEHPYYGSWGYQVTGYFAPTSRYGRPEDLMYLVDHLHQRGLGVILDWVPSHFATDAHGLGYFDGTHLYEHADPRRGFHPDWGSYIFNYGRHEVRSFLISSALYWLEQYHVDALRVDAVASMLYLDYSRKPGDWIPNRFGGRENLEAIDLLRRLNEEVPNRQPGALTIAEESTSWPMVSRPPYVGGLGFGMKWDMGWMHDTLDYLGRDPVHRKYHHQELTFRSIYAFSENFVLPLSHDEVVHGKGSLINKMPGDAWQKFANLRLLFALMYTSPGKKLVFMGAELAQWREWAHEAELDWALAEQPLHAGIGRWLADLNRLYRSEPALGRSDFDPAGFSWADADDSLQSVLTFARRGGGRQVLVALNFTPLPRYGYRIGVSHGGRWSELLNSDSEHYGGSGLGNLGFAQAVSQSWHGQEFSIEVNLPPLAAVVFGDQPMLDPA
ncbi:MAG TPA: 1,4-alpha-glucan branching protein GlgB [Candidatus Nitrosotalea sp.]|nr:1,4-alpha-glucan branching protein GlgB [Candidatus Nitrosotalea sp.]